MAFITKKTGIQDLFVVDVAPVSDHRGRFARFFCEQELAPLLNGRKITQINHSCTKIVGAIRGLHFQYPPHAEMKLVRCLRGRVWDVAVDLRYGSETFLHWHAEELSFENLRMFVIPEGFAHGFQVLEEDSELLYLHTAAYNKDSEGGLCFDDPALQIDWPQACTDISEKDKKYKWIDIHSGGIKL